MGPQHLVLTPKTMSWSLGGHHTQAPPGGAAYSGGVCGCVLTDLVRIVILHTFADSAKSFNLSESYLHHP